MKKILLTIGTVSTIVAPLASTIACGEEGFKKKEVDYKLLYDLDQVDYKNINRDVTYYTGVINFSSATSLDLLHSFVKAVGWTDDSPMLVDVLTDERKRLLYDYVSPERVLPLVVRSKDDMSSYELLEDWDVADQIASLDAPINGVPQERVADYIRTWTTKREATTAGYLEPAGANGAFGKGEFATYFSKTLILEGVMDQTFKESLDPFFGNYSSRGNWSGINEAGSAAGSMMTTASNYSSFTNLDTGRVDLSIKFTTFPFGMGSVIYEGVNKAHRYHDSLTVEEVNKASYQMARVIANLTQLVKNSEAQIASFGSMLGSQILSIINFIADGKWDGFDKLINIINKIDDDFIEQNNESRNLSEILTEDEFNWWNDEYLQKMNPLINSGFFFLPSIEMFTYGIKNLPSIDDNSYYPDKNGSTHITEIEGMGNAKDDGESVATISSLQAWFKHGKGLLSIDTGKEGQ